MNQPIPSTEEFGEGGSITVGEPTHSAVFTVDQNADGQFVIRRGGELFAIAPSRYEAIELFNALDGAISKRG